MFGGNTHNDTQFSQGAKCYSADFIAYDIACDRWYSLGRRSQDVLLFFINIFYLFISLFFAGMLYYVYRTSLFNLIAVAQYRVHPPVMYWVYSNFFRHQVLALPVFKQKWFCGKNCLELWCSFSVFSGHHMA